MSLQFITGASGSGKSTYIDQQIIARSEREPEGRFFILVPDQFTMQTQKDLVSLHDRKGIMNIDVLSFGRLTHRIFEEMGANRLPMLDDTGKSLIIRRVAAGQRGELPVLGGRLGQTGYIHEVKSAISEFMQYGIGLQELDQLTEFSKKRGQLYYKLKDLRTSTASKAAFRSARTSGFRAFSALGRSMVMISTAPCTSVFTNAIVKTSYSNLINYHKQPPDGGKALRFPSPSGSVIQSGFQGVELSPSQRW